MNIAELRIRNLVTIDNPNAWPDLKGVPMIVTGISTRVNIPDFPKSNGGVTLERGYDTYSQFNEFIKPIPITEDWLQRANAHQPPARRDFFRLSGMLLVLNPDGPGAEPSDINVHIGVTGQYITTLKYVHQLQNLYFAIKGTELEFNL